MDGQAMTAGGNSNNNQGLKIGQRNTGNQGGGGCCG